MAKYSIEDTTLTGMSDAVRGLNGDTAKRTPYQMMAAIEAASSEVATQTELLEQILAALDKKLQEVWYFNRNIPCPAVDTTYTVDFTFVHPTGETRTAHEIYIPSSNMEDMLYLGDGFTTMACNMRVGWTNESFRTITLAKPATGDLLTFLQSNATKIS